MFRFSKSVADLQNKKSDIQHKVICDWLRQVHSQNIQIARKLSIITKLLTEEGQSSSPPGELMEYDNRGDTESV